MAQYTILGQINKIVGNLSNGKKMVFVSYLVSNPGSGLMDDTPVTIELLSTIDDFIFGTPDGGLMWQNVFHEFTYGGGNTITMKNVMRITNTMRMCFVAVGE